MVVLIGAHEAGQHHLAGQTAGFLQRRGFRPQDDGVVLAHLHAGHGSGVADVTGHVQPGTAVFQGFQLALQEIGLADEVGHELIDGMVVDFLGGADLLHHTGAHDDNPVGQSHGLALVVGDVNGGDAHFLLNPADFRPHGHAQLGVQVGKGLVEE